MKTSQNVCYITLLLLTQHPVYGTEDGFTLVTSAAQVKCQPPPRSLGQGPACRGNGPSITWESCSQMEDIFSVTVGCGWARGWWALPSSPLLALEEGFLHLGWELIVSLLLVTQRTFSKDTRGSQPALCQPHVETESRPGVFPPSVLEILQVWISSMIKGTVSSPWLPPFMPPQ